MQPAGHQCARLEQLLAGKETPRLFACNCPEADAAKGTECWGLWSTASCSVGWPVPWGPQHTATWGRRLHHAIRAMRIKHLAAILRALVPGPGLREELGTHPGPCHSLAACPTPSPPPTSRVALRAAVTPRVTHIPVATGPSVPGRAHMQPKAPPSDRQGTAPTPHFPPPCSGATSLERTEHPIPSVGATQSPSLHTQGFAFPAEGSPHTQGLISALPWGSIRGRRLSTGSHCQSSPLSLSTYSQLQADPRQSCHVPRSSLVPKTSCLPGHGTCPPHHAAALRWLWHKAYMAVLARMEDSMACSSVRADGRLW